MLMLTDGHSGSNSTGAGIELARLEDPPMISAAES